MDEWVDFYKRVFGFRHFLTFDDKDISTEYSALRSKVVASENGKVKFPINEPAPGRGKSQIQEYLDYYHGPGVQHIALLTGDVLGTVAELRRRGVEFLEVPDAYYDAMPDAGRARSRRTSSGSATCASWSIATTAATSCSSSPSRWRTGRPSSSRSSSGAAARDSARGTSRRSSSRSSGNRPAAETCERRRAPTGRSRRKAPAADPRRESTGASRNPQRANHGAAPDQGGPMPYYHRLGQIPRKRHTVFRRPTGGRSTTRSWWGSEGFTGPSSLFYHLHPPR